MKTTEPNDYASIKSLFLALHEAGAAERAAQLAVLERERPELAAALQRMLAAAATPLASLDQAAREPAAAEFPRYRCLRELGRGGMGRVWLAERSDGAFVQRYALKQLDREHGSETERERFVRERQILAELDHRNIASLVDGGSDSRGAPFLVTAYVDGERIDDYCEQHHLDLRDRVALVRDLADAIAYAHRRLVVHRDIKPASGTSAIGMALLECRESPTPRHLASMRELAGGTTSDQRWAKTLVQQWITECEAHVNATKS